MYRGNKRGQDLSIGTLILIVLGIVILVLLILGFSIGWKDLFAKIGILSGGSNLETISQACGIHSSANAVGSYCEFKQVTINGNVRYINCNYKDLPNNNWQSLSCTKEDTRSECENLIDASYASRFKDAEKMLDPTVIKNMIADCQNAFKNTYVNSETLSCGNKNSGTNFCDEEINNLQRNLGAVG